MSKISELISLTNSKEARVLSINCAWLTALQFAGYILPFITLPYLARVIGVDGLGKIAFASAIVAWVNTIVNWGFNYTATRDIARNKHSTRNISAIFSSVLWTRIVLMLACLAVLVLLTLIIPLFAENRAIIFVSFLLIPGYILSSDWVFQGLERMKYISILTILSRIIFTILVFIFIKSREDFILQPLLMSAGSIFSGIIGFWILKRWGIVIYPYKTSTVVKYLKNSFDIFLNQLIPNVYNNFSIILLGAVGGANATGIFDAGAKFATATDQFLSILTRIFFPFLSRKIDHHNKFATLNISITFCASLCLFIGAPFIIKIFFAPTFSDAIIVLRILSISLIFMSLYQAYGTNYLIIIGKEKVLRNITSISSIIGFFMAIPCVYFWSYIGAAATIATVRIIMGISIAWVSHSIKLHLPKERC